jgi:hypothetical protein
MLAIVFTKDCGMLSCRVKDYSIGHKLKVVCATWNLNNQTLATCPNDDLCDWLTQQTEKHQVVKANPVSSPHVSKHSTATNNKRVSLSSQQKQNQQLQNNINEVVDNIMQQFTEKLTANTNPQSASSSSSSSTPQASPRGTNTNGGSAFTFPQPSAQPAPGPQTELADIYAIGMQEIVELVPSNIVFNSSTTYNRSVFWLGELLKAFDRLHALESNSSSPATTTSPFVAIAEEHLVGMQIFVFVRSHLVPCIRNVQALNVGCGAFGYMGNKGAVGVCLQIFECSMCFMCSHLRSGGGAENCKGRCEDYFSILDRGVFSSGSQATSSNGSASGVASTVSDNNYSEQLYASAVEQANSLKDAISSSSEADKGKPLSTDKVAVWVGQQRAVFVGADAVDDSATASERAFTSAHTSITSNSHISMSHQLESWHSGRFSSPHASANNANAANLNSARTSTQASLGASGSSSGSGVARSGSALQLSLGFDYKNAVSGMLNVELVDKWRRIPVSKFADANGVDSASAQQTAPPTGLGPLDHDVVFWFGDFNFRLDSVLTAEDVSDKNVFNWTDGYCGRTVKTMCCVQVFEICNVGRWCDVLRYDQLITSMRKREVFEKFKEGPITFAPTYKYAPGSTHFESRGGKKIRVPAWCDR